MQKGDIINGREIIDFYSKKTTKVYVVRCQLCNATARGYISQLKKRQCRKCKKEVNKEKTIENKRRCAREYYYNHKESVLEKKRAEYKNKITPKYVVYNNKIEKYFCKKKEIAIFFDISIYKVNKMLTSDYSIKGWYCDEIFMG